MQSVPMHQLNSQSFIHQKPLKYMIKLANDLSRIPICTFKLSSKKNKLEQGANNSLGHPWPVLGDERLSVQILDLNRRPIKQVV